MTEIALTRHSEQIRDSDFFWGYLTPGRQPSPQFLLPKILDLSFLKHFHEETYGLTSQTENHNHSGEETLYHSPKSAQNLTTPVPEAERGRFLTASFSEGWQVRATHVQTQSSHESVRLNRPLKSSPDDPEISEHTHLLRSQYLPSARDYEELRRSNGFFVLSPDRQVLIMATSHTPDIPPFDPNGNNSFYDHLESDYKGAEEIMRPLSDQVWAAQNEGLSRLGESYDNSQDPIFIEREQAFWAEWARVEEPILWGIANELSVAVYESEDMSRFQRV